MRLPTAGLFLTVLLVAACAPPHRHVAQQCDDPAAKKGNGGDANAALEQRLVALKPELHLMQDQETSWTVLLDNLKESTEQPPTDEPRRRPRLNGTESTRAALDRFYASLTPEQRVVMDRTLPREPPPCLDAGPPSGSIYGRSRAKPPQ